MSTYINGTFTTGYGLYSPSQNPVTIGSSGSITNTNANRFSGDAIYGNTAAAWAITNRGTLNAYLGSSTGIDLAGGGTVTNATGGHIYGRRDGVSIIGSVGTVSNAAGAVIAGGLNGVYLLAAAGTISNSGAIEAAAPSGRGIYLAAVAVGAGITNAQGGLVSGGFDGIRVVANSATVTNSGTIQATALNGAGVALFGSAGSVSNFGTIEGSGTHSYGLYLEPGSAASRVSNASGALISGQAFGVYLIGAGTVANSGAIIGTGIASAGINMKAGTVVNGATNATSALISGLVDGVYLFGSAGVLTNFGTIIGTGTHSTGAYFKAGGVVINNASALLSGYYDGVRVGGVASASRGTITNFGTVQGTGALSDGARLVAYGYVSNQSGGLIRGALDGVEVDSSFATLSNSGTIAGAFAVYMNAGTVVNGATNATSALISGVTKGVLIGGNTGTVTNFGDIVATATAGIGVYLKFGTVTNFGTVIAGTNGTGIYLLSGNVTNSGTIIAVGPLAKAVVVRDGTFFNHGVILGAVYGIEVSPGTSNTNHGSVVVAGAVSGATGIKVLPSGTVSQTITVSGTVTGTAGTIAGTAGTAVSLGGGTNRLIVDPGALFQGKVDGGSASSVLEIAAAGPGPGGSGPGGAQGSVAYVSLGSVVNFSALQIDPSATLDSLGALSFDTLVNQGQINVASGDSLAFGSVAGAAGTGVIDLRAGGMIDFKGAVANQTLIFNPAGGSATIGQPAAFGGTIADFTASLDSIDLTGVAFAGNTSVGFNSATDVLTVTEGGGSANLQLDAETYAGITWSAAQDAGTGTDVTIACFCRGTLILTERGEVAVEELAIGDRVVTISGAARPIKWIGRRSYSGRFAVGQKHILPVCIAAGALADGVPRRDLWVSPNHALYLEGVLIEVRDLVNHVSIVQAERVAAIEYFHIELDGHDVIVAEGAAAESFIDDDSRSLFHNAHEYRALYPAAAAGPARYCAPRRDQGYEVERARAVIARRAGIAVAGEMPPPGLAFAPRSIQVRRSLDGAGLTRSTNLAASHMAQSLAGPAR